MEEGKGSEEAQLSCLTTLEKLVEADSKLPVKQVWPHSLLKEWLIDYMYLPSHSEDDVIVCY